MIFLVAMIGSEKSHEVRDLAASFHNQNIRVLEVKEEFSRGSALNRGAAEFQEHELILFMDVDMSYSEEFLNRCRNNAILGKRVFFPIPWSQYDPKVIKSGNPPGKPEVRHLDQISKWTGYWIHYGYGMVCLYKADFVPFERIQGWGGEDVAFFKAMVARWKAENGEFQILHSVEPDLVHRYHSRSCDKAGLSKDQYRMCIGAMADTLGNKQQLGVLYLDSQ